MAPTPTTGCLAPNWLTPKPLISGWQVTKQAKILYIFFLFFVPGQPVAFPLGFDAPALRIVLIIFPLHHILSFFSTPFFSWAEESVIITYNTTFHIRIFVTIVAILHTYILPQQIDYLSQFRLPYYLFPSLRTLIQNTQNKH